ncbi:MAG: RluA family pseudouridine synthase [Nitrosomonas sp.]|nr:MAG: RluA family pseudouridine synthase [Nitrosomonas sp.]
MHDGWIVQGFETGQRLGAFLKTKMGAGYTAREIKRWVESNLCEVNGTIERFASSSLKAGDRVVLRQSSLATSALPVELYSDNDLAAYDKPAGVTSEALAKQLSLHLVHRLDKDTSGVIIFAKNSKAKKAMEELFRRREVAKAYLAVVVGVPKQREGLITGYLGKIHSYQGQTVYGSVAEGKGLYAETAWRLVKNCGDTAIIACYPKTGRTHQIRIHMMEIGHPILGDYQYARTQKSSHRPQHHLLHAWKIAFVHPITGNKVQIKAGEGTIKRLYSPILNTGY